MLGKPSVDPVLHPFLQPPPVVPSSRSHRAKQSMDELGAARSSAPGSYIRSGRCDQFAASLRQAAIVLPGEVEKQNAAGGVVEKGRRKAASSGT